MSGHRDKVEKKPDQSINENFKSTLLGTTNLGTEHPGTLKLYNKD